MNSACASQPDCSSSGCDGSHAGPARRHTTKNIAMPPSTTCPACYTTIGATRSARAAEHLRLHRRRVAAQPLKRLAGDHEQPHRRGRDDRRRARRVGEKSDLAEELAAPCCRKGGPRAPRPTRQRERRTRDPSPLLDQTRSRRLVELVGEARDLPELLLRALREEWHRRAEGRSWRCGAASSSGSYETGTHVRSTPRAEPRARLPTQTHATQPTATAPTVGQ